MGNCNCFHSRSLTYSERTNEMLTSNEHLQKKQLTKGRNHLHKKRTLPFDRKNFIHIKNTNVYDFYNFEVKLGSGAFGCVYKATSKKTGLTRAIKLISKKRVLNQDFENELLLFKSLDHPNIVKLFDCYVDDNFYYLIEEYCSGGDLFDFIKSQRSFTEKKIACIIYQLLSAINYLHSKKIVHRDIKPENIVIVSVKNQTKGDSNNATRNTTQEEDNQDIFIKLIDFGISISMQDEPLKQEIGTIYYIAPEVFKNSYNEKADIWSVGIILYTMFCGHPPFRGRKEEDIKNKIIIGNVGFPSEQFSRISPSAISFIKALLTYNPYSRPSAEIALNDPWLVSTYKSKNENPVNSEVMKTLVKFQSSNTLQKAALTYISHQLSQGEELKKLNEEFNKIDQNKDGVISREELLDCLSHVYSREEAILKVEEIFNEIDFNNDGTINYSEFIAVNMKKDNVCNEENLKKAFYLFDLDGNGFITIDELKETIPLELGTVSWEDIVKEVDSNGDGMISFDEFKRMMEKISTMCNSEQ